jgi:hypothetical protein
MFIGVEGEWMIATGDSNSDQCTGITVAKSTTLQTEHAKNTLYCNAGHPFKTRVGASPKSIEK